VPPAPDPAGQERAPVVVYLEPVQGAPRAPRRLPTVTVHPDPAAFFPAFLVVAAGQELRFPGSPEVYHHVFSYSKPNDFDLGVAEQGDARVVTLHHSGAVRLYCSLHPWETGLVFVSPSPYFDTVDDAGSYEIREVPPGRYRLIAWAEARSGASRIVTVRHGRSTPVELSAPEPAAPAPGARP
jgi:plastocyanin